MAKSKYLKNSEIEEIEHHIYNDLSLTDYYNVSYPSFSFDKDSFEKLLKKGEKYCILDELELEGIVVTSLGRVFNMITVRQLGIAFSYSILVYKNHTKIDVEAIFDNNLWEYDIKKILKTYKKYGWRHRIHKHRPRKSKYKL